MSPVSRQKGYVLATTPENGSLQYAHHTHPGLSKDSMGPLPEHRIAAIESDLNVQLPPLSARSAVTPSCPSSPGRPLLSVRSRDGGNGGTTPRINSQRSTATGWRSVSQSASSTARSAASASGTRSDSDEEDISHGGFAACGYERPVTRDTMALAKHNLSEFKGSRLIWRNSHLEASVEEHHSELAELALYRCDCKKDAAQFSRTRARQWRKWKRIKMQQEAREAADQPNMELPSISKLPSDGAATPPISPRSASTDRKPSPKFKKFIRVDTLRDLDAIMSEKQHSRASLLSLGMQTQPGQVPLSVKRGPMAVTPAAAKGNGGGKGDGAAPIGSSLKDMLKFHKNAGDDGEAGTTDGEENREKPRSGSKPPKEVAKPPKEVAKPDKGSLARRLRNIKDRLRRKCPSNLIFQQETQWSNLSEEERTQIRQIYDRHLHPKCDRSQLVAALSAALQDFGLCGRTAGERDELSTLCKESVTLGHVDFRNFYFKVVPQARVYIAELLRPKLKKVFKELCDKSGMLGVRECQQINESEILVENPLMSKEAYQELRQYYVAELEKLEVSAKEDPERFTADLGIRRDPRKGFRVDFENCELACHRSHEEFLRSQRATLYHLRTETELSSMSAEVWDAMATDVLSMYVSFQQFDVDASGQLDAGEVRCMLMEYGFLSGKQKEDELIMKIVDAADSDGNGLFTFFEVLDLVTNIRSELRRKAKPQIEAMFERLDKDGSGTLSTQEVTLCFSEMGLVPKDRMAQNEIGRLLQAVDSNCDGEIGILDFENLACLVQEKLHTITRLQEMDMGHELNIPEEKVREYRDAFWALDEDGSGHLDIQELRKAMLLLRQRISGDMLRVLFFRIDKDGNGKLDFSEFLQLMHLLEQMAEKDKEVVEHRNSTLADRVLETLPA